MSDFNVSVPDLESIPEADINDRVVSGIEVDLKLSPLIFGVAEVDLAEPKGEGAELNSIDDPLVKENFEQGLEIARLKNQLATEQDALTDMHSINQNLAEQFEKLRIAHGIQSQIVANQEADIKTLQDNLSTITQSFNVCRSMLIHIGEVMKVIEDQRVYIQGLVDSPAIQSHIGVEQVQIG